MERLDYLKRILKQGELEGESSRNLLLRYQPQVNNDKKLKKELNELESTKRPI